MDVNLSIPVWCFWTVPCVLAWIGLAISASNDRSSYGFGALIHFLIGAGVLLAFITAWLVYLFAK